MSRFITLLLSLFAAAGSPAAAASYDFPFRDPLVATVLGTPREYRAPIEVQAPRRERRIVIFPDRELPSIVPRKALHYSVAFQDQAAPLIFVIAGTGGSHRGESMRIFESVFYAEGFHVVSLASPTFANFIINGSTTHVPGRTFDDAEDLYRVMQAIVDKHRDDITVTDFHITGYSLGGANAAFVARLDQQRRVFNFKRVLMINPPLSLYNSARILDRMLDKNIPGPVAPNFATFLDGVFSHLMGVYRDNDDIEFNDEFLYQVYRRDLEEGRKAKPEDLEALIGAAFRISSANMLTTADFAAQRGYIVPKNYRFRISESTTPYLKVAFRTSFGDYIDDLYLPFFLERIPGSTREALIAESSLKSIESFLRDAQHVGMMHNVDDIIMAPGEIDYLREVLGDRAKIYPSGGHCGNMAHRDNVAYMVDFFKD